MYELVLVLGILGNWPHPIEYYLTPEFLSTLPQQHQFETEEACDQAGQMQAHMIGAEVQRKLDLELTIAYDFGIDFQISCKRINSSS